ncbi:hypothetical protein B0H10DRAFT_2207985 [Mycena sp. CBHHK59/15]|nr:hypothetical protein B0H10DRAFT_2207985 [Mycena sp. CBHHK59/15]
MKFSPCATFFRLAFLGTFCALSFVHALPAVAGLHAVSKPISLLGRSYTNRVTDPLTVNTIRPMGLDAQMRQVDGHSPLRRAARFQIAQRRATESLSSSAVNQNEEVMNGGVEAREILLSHQQLVPSVPSQMPPVALPATSTSSSTPVSQATPTPTPASRAAKSGKPEKTKAEAKHGGHRVKVQHASAE